MPEPVYQFAGRFNRCAVGQSAAANFDDAAAGGSIAECIGGSWIKPGNDLFDLVVNFFSRHVEAAESHVASAVEAARLSKDPNSNSRIVSCTDHCRPAAEVASQKAPSQHRHQQKDQQFQMLSSHVAEVGNWLGSVATLNGRYTVV